MHSLREPRRDADARRGGHRHRRRRRDDAATSTSAPATVIWAAGVLAAGVSSVLAEASGAETDRVGRLLVEPDLSLPGHPEVLAIGDMVQIRGARTRCPASPRWRCRWAATRPSSSRAGCAASDVGPFKYKDKGNLATIGRGARGGRAAAADPGLGLPGLGALARDPPLLPGRLPEPAAGASSAGASASSRTGAGRG